MLLCRTVDVVAGVIARELRCLRAVVAVVGDVGCSSMGVRIVQFIVEMLVHLLLLSHCVRRQRRQYPRSHGSTGEAAQDQHQHQNEIEAATHPWMIRRWGKWFHLHFKTPLCKRADKGKPRQIVEWNLG